METYTVWVTFNKERLEIKNVTSDGIMPDTFRMRWFMLQDFTRLEFPMDNTSFEFSPERELQRIERAKAQMAAPTLVANP